MNIYTKNRTRQSQAKFDRKDLLIKLAVCTCLYALYLVAIFKG